MRPLRICFEKLCSVAISLQVHGQIFDARVPSLGQNGASERGATSHGLQFRSLNALQEYGLIIPDYDSYTNYSICIAKDNKVTVGFTYAGALYAFLPKESSPASAEFRVSGVSLTKAGQELSQVVPLLPEPEYTADMLAFFETQGFKVVPVGTTAA